MMCPGEEWANTPPEARSGEVSRGGRTAPHSCVGCNGCRAWGRKAFKSGLGAGACAGERLRRTGVRLPGHFQISLQMQGSERAIFVKLQIFGVRRVPRVGP
jgi:hypothetical protein